MLYGLLAIRAALVARALFVHCGKESESDKLGVIAVSYRITRYEVDGAGRRALHLDLRVAADKKISQLKPVDCVVGVRPWGKSVGGRLGLGEEAAPRVDPTPRKKETFTGQFSLLYTNSRMCEIKLGTEEKNRGIPLIE